MIAASLREISEDLLITGGALIVTLVALSMLVVFGIWLGGLIVNVYVEDDDE